MTAADDLRVEAKYEASRCFSHFVTQVDDGDLEQELTAELATLLAKLEDHANATRGKAKGKITLSLDFTVDDKGNTTITGDVVVKKPKPKRGGSHMWLLKGKLSSRNPRQQELPLHDVTARRDVADPASKGVVR